MAIGDDWTAYLVCHKTAVQRDQRLMSLECVRRRLGDGTDAAWHTDDVAFQVPFRVARRLLQRQRETLRQSRQTVDPWLHHMHDTRKIVADVGVRRVRQEGPTDLRLKRVGFAEIKISVNES